MKIALVFLVLVSGCAYYRNRVEVLGHDSEIWIRVVHEKGGYPEKEETNWGVYHCRTSEGGKAGCIRAAFIGNDGKPVQP